MKENKLSDKKILHTLERKGFIEIMPICDECSTYIFNLVINHFTSAHINIEQVEDNIYMMRIAV